jgi:hypothetical protein
MKKWIRPTIAAVIWLIVFAGILMFARSTIISSIRVVPSNVFLTMIGFVLGIILFYIMTMKIMGFNQLI